ncbi:hypothetical protein G9A89_007584 [Geosiphon pyriformis]|nr:hypothetical protein G9A89_007584 [Geosiphon pyriformis]
MTKSLGLRHFFGRGGETVTADFGPEFLLYRIDTDLAQINGALGYYCLLWKEKMKPKIEKKTLISISFLQSGAVLKYDMVFDSDDEEHYKKITQYLMVNY